MLPSGGNNLLKQFLVEFCNLVREPFEERRTSMRRIITGMLLGVGLLSLASCGGGTIGSQIIKKDMVITKDRMMHLACDFEDRQDWEIHKAITKELEARGFTVVDRKAERFDRCEGIAVRYEDSWTWDITMYLRELRIRLLDGETGLVLAVSVYSGSGFFHGGWPDPNEVVADLFVDLDKKGVF